MNQRRRTGASVANSSRARTVRRGWASAGGKVGEGQASFTFRTWGGKRAGAGRPAATGEAKRVAHAVRPRLASRFPVHVTMRLRADVPRLRNRKLWAELRRVFAHCCDLGRFRLCQFSVQGNHLHLICEATDASALSKGMQRVASMLARRINKPSGRRGAVFVDRYHSRIIKTPAQARNTLSYVLHNARRHTHLTTSHLAGTDPFSSAWYFDGWRDPSWRAAVGPPDDPRPPVAPARTWLLSTGWRRRGLLVTDETPPAALAR